MGNPSVKLLDRVRQGIRLKGYSIRTEKSNEWTSFSATRHLSGIME